MPLLSRLSAIALVVGILPASAAMAHVGLGQPTPWQLGQQGTGSPVMADTIWSLTYVLCFVTVITAFVLALPVIILFRRNARANPTPSRTTRYTPIEVICRGLPTWTCAGT